MSTVNPGMEHSHYGHFSYASNDHIPHYESFLHNDLMPDFHCGEMNHNLIDSYIPLFLSMFLNGHSHYGPGSFSYASNILIYY